VVAVAVVVVVRVVVVVLVMVLVDVVVVAVSAVVDVMAAVVAIVVVVVAAVLRVVVIVVVAVVVAVVDVSTRGRAHTRTSSRAEPHHVFSEQEKSTCVLLLTDVKFTVRYTQPMLAKLVSLTENSKSGPKG
jgi:hypothetical protein